MSNFEVIDGTIYRKAIPRREVSRAIFLERISTLSDRIGEINTKIAELQDEKTRLITLRTELQDLVRGV